MRSLATFEDYEMSTQQQKMEAASNEVIPRLDLSSPSAIFSQRPVLPPLVYQQPDLPMQGERILYLICAFDDLEMARGGG